MKLIKLLLLTICSLFAVHGFALETSGSCGEGGDNVVWNFDTETGLLTISGTGKMISYTPGQNTDERYNPYPWGKFVQSITQVVIEEGVTRISVYAFYICGNLTSVSISESVSYIGQYAFGGCQSLTSITIPKGITTIDANTFSNCARLATIEVPEGIKSISPYAFAGTAWWNNQQDGYVYIQKILYAYKGETPQATSPDIKEGTMRIENDVFSNWTNLTSVTIPSSVTSIGGYAFSGCTNLKTVTIEDGSEALSMDGVFVFNYCPIETVYIGRNMEIGFNTPTLTNVTIGDQVTKLCSFSDCTGLTEIKMPNSVTEIVSFSGCTGLVEIDLSDNLQKIGGRAFYGCTGLKEITFPGKAEINVGQSAFDNCTSLTKIVKEKGSSINFIAGGFGNCPIETIYMGAEFIWGNTSPFRYKATLKEVIIEEGVTAIGKGAFEGCTNLTQIKFPETLINIGESAFNNCNLNGELLFSESLKTVGLSAFAYCSNIEKLTFEGQVYSFGEKAFYNCNGLKNVILKSSVTPPTCYSNTFDGISRLTLHIPHGSKELYANHPVWRNFTTVEDVFLQNDVAGQLAVISWYPVKNASAYSITVYTDEDQTQIYKTYNLDAEGSLRMAGERISYTLQDLSAETMFFYTLSAFDSEHNNIVSFSDSFTTTAGTSIEVIVSDSKLRVYPNPVLESFNVNGLEKDSFLTICDMTGKIVLQQMVSPNERISISHLPQGLYLVRINDEIMNIIKQ
ncbi:T9SS C-terminal target domain-containing protein [Dysgonomonas sp. 216]|uniref:leucine-rich repeat protein n=1 Tax=Dysgonomonas sp. 216 TaxID=2302934 RepID=UPI0013D6BCD6|nr:leucine-rich repeat protein [Dysgonomonas sp. 216]NDW19016.1 T9SS C-terminal target domain-containing protein [Dysgonomonas sp. 216]